MKQQESILQWATHVLDEPVVNLKAIQDVKFVKNLLWKIDDYYFQDWQWGKGSQSYSQVLQTIGKYFKQQIGTDISQQLTSLNVYKNVIEVWELLLGIAIKGNNRNNNINIIFELDHSMQAQLVTTVSNIIDKFGQNTAPIDAEEPNEEKEGGGGKDRQMVIELLQENEQLRQECKRLENDLIKEKQDKNILNSLKSELQHNLEIMRLEKFSFFEIIANANRSDSKIFDDGDGGVLQSQSNLSELAQDIVQFIRQQRKKFLQITEKNTYLQEQTRELKEGINKCIEENEIYLMKLGDLNLYEREIQALRLDINDKIEENLDLREMVTSLEDQKLNLIFKIQKKALEEYSEPKSNEKKPLEVNQRVEEKEEPRKNERRLQKKQTLNNQDLGQSITSEEGEKSDRSVVTEKQDAAKKQMDDELRQPELRNKLQRQIIYLKKNINGLNRQIEALKRANEALQRSAKTFMESNHKVITKWEDDYEGLIQKMGALNQMNDDLKSQSNNDKQSLAQLQRLKEESQAKLVSQAAEEFQKEQKDISASQSSVSEESNTEEIQIRISESLIKTDDLTKEILEKSKRDKVALWDEIVKKLREIVRQGKTKELAYENSLLSLRNQNQKLIELLRNRNKSEIGMNDSSLKAPQHLQESYFSKLQRVESEEMRESKGKLAPPRLLSYVEIQQGEELEQSTVSQFKQRERFYNMNSRLVNDINQRKPQPSIISHTDDYYYNVNRKLASSIRESLEGMNHRICEQDVTGSIELQKKMDEEISRITKQYQKLNGNYQNVFNKLHIYTQNLKEKEFVKQGYENVLEEISKAEIEIKASHEAEIVKLRIVNQALNQQIAQSIIEKQEFSSQLSKLSNNITELKSKEDKSKTLVYSQMQHVLNEIASRFSQSIKDPLNFLESCLEGTKEEGQLQKFYRLFIKERDKTRQLNEELELLSSVLLEYRNMILA